MVSAGEIFTALGYATGALVFWLGARERQMATDGIGRLALIGVFAGIVGAKLTQLVFSGWPVTVPVEAALDPRVGGRALLGGLVVGWLAVEIAKRRMGIRRSTGDLFALALPAGEAVGRIGCYLNGCCYGAVCSLPWAVDQHGATRHPAQLYSAAAAFGLFLALLWARRHVSTEGVLFKLYLAGFGLSRFGLEFVRDRQTLILGLSPMQWFCLELTVFAAVALARARYVAARERA